MRVCQIFIVAIILLLTTGITAAKLPVTPTENCLDTGFSSSAKVVDAIIIRDTELYDSFSYTTGLTVKKGQVFTSSQKTREVFVREKSTGKKIRKILTRSLFSDDCLAVTSGNVSANDIVILTKNQSEELRELYSPIKAVDTKKLQEIEFNELLKLIPPREWEMSINPLIDDRMHDFHGFAYMIADANLYTYKGVETPYELKKGTVVLARIGGARNHSAGFDASAVRHHIQGGHSGTLVPVNAVRPLDNDEVKEILDIVFPIVGRTASAKSYAAFSRVAGIVGNDTYVGYLNIKEPISYEVLRSTRDGKWYFLQYWNDSRGAWKKGFVPKHVVTLDPTPEELAAERKRQAEQDELVRIKLLEDQARADEVKKIQREQEAKRLAEEKRLQAEEIERLRLLDIEKQTRTALIYKNVAIGYVVFFIMVLFSGGYRMLSLRFWYSVYEKIYSFAPLPFLGLYLVISYICLGIAGYMYLHGTTDTTPFIIAAIGALPTGIITGLLMIPPVCLLTLFMLPGLLYTFSQAAMFWLSPKFSGDEEVDLRDDTVRESMSPEEMRYREFRNKQQTRTVQSEADKYDKAL